MISSPEGNFSVARVSNKVVNHIMNLLRDNGREEKEIEEKVR